MYVITIYLGAPKPAKPFERSELMIRDTKSATMHLDPAFERVAEKIILAPRQKQTLEPMYDMDPHTRLPLGAACPKTLAPLKERLLNTFTDARVQGTA